ncbi:MAG: universal stress protein A [Porticoccus sp.]|jgi:universal stress protein A
MTMSDYNHLLLAIDLSEHSDQVAAKARHIADASNAKLSVIHVIEPISFSYGGDIPLDFTSIQEDIQAQAKTQLAKLGVEYGINEEDQYIMLGRPENEIHGLAEEIDANLIVVGSHGRHGLALIFGSTANGVLHGAGCDVLAVRVKS